jgi:curved DNA-binding protein CbpA
VNGNLADEPLPNLLQQLFGQQATGVLHIQNRAGRHDVFMRAGYPVAVTLPGSAELLGKVLFEMGIIDEPTYKRTLAEPPAEGQRYGDMLLQKGIVNEDQVRLALKAQVRRKLHRLFFLNDGTFEFVGGEHEQGLQKSESLRIHPARAVYHGVRSAWNAERLKAALFLLSSRAIRCLLTAEEVARYGVGPDDGRVAELLRKGYWTLPDLVEASGLPQQPVHALVYALYITDALDVKAASEVPRLRKRSETPLPPNASAAPTDASGAFRMPSQITPLPVKSHSQVGPLPGMNDPSGVLRLPTVLSGPPSMSGASQPRLRTPTPPSVTGLDQGPPDSESVKRQLLAKAQVVESQNLFEVLEIPQVATKDEVKQAYFVAAKRYHPDRLPALGLDALRGEVEKIFRRISEAYGTLYDDTRREDYKTSLTRPSGDDAEAHAKAMKMLEAEMAFRRGEILLKKNDFLGAIRELEQSVALNPTEGEHLAFLTWARVCAGQTTHADAKPVFNQAIKLSPMCGRAYFYLAVCLKEDKDIDRAYNTFRKAKELDPRLLDAEREMRLINMRREKEKGGGGFFDRFRKPSK